MTDTRKSLKLELEVIEARFEALTLKLSETKREHALKLTKWEQANPVMGSLYGKGSSVVMLVSKDANVVLSSGVIGSYSHDEVADAYEHMGNHNDVFIRRDDVKLQHIVRDELRQLLADTFDQDACGSALTGSDLRTLIADKFNVDY